MPYNLQQIEELVTTGTYEDRHLDFKQSITFDDKGKLDLRKDVAAMAFVGGDIILGVAEKRVGNVKTAQASQITPIAYQSKDQFTLWLEAVIRDGINPRVFGVHVEVFEHNPGLFVASIHIPRSIFAPHMVKDDMRCYMRGSGGNVVMDISDLRNAFLASAGYVESARKWRDARLEKIARRFVVPLSQGPLQVLHLIPLSFAAGHEHLPVRVLSEQRNYLRPLDKDCSPEHQYNVDGYIAKFQTEGFVQFFRTGQIESCAALWSPQDHPRWLDSTSLERNVIELSALYLQAMRNAGIDPPIMISLSFIDIGDYLLMQQHGSGQITPSKPIQPSDFTLPEVLLEEWHDDPQQLPSILRPMIDSIWNAAGLSGSPNYAHDSAYRKELRL